MKKTTSTDEITMQSLQAHLCLVIVMRSCKKAMHYQHPQLKLIQAYSHQTVRIVTPVCGMLKKGVLIVIAESSLMYHITCFQICRGSTCIDNQITFLRNTSFQAYLELVELNLSYKSDLQH